MPQPNDLSRSLVALDQNSTIIAVIEMSQSSWLVAGMLPGIERQPRKKLEPRPERQIRPCQRESERHRRGADDWPRFFRAHQGSGAARLALQHGRLDRSRAAARDRRRCRLPRP